MDADALLTRLREIAAQRSAVRQLEWPDLAFLTLDQVTAEELQALLDRLARPSSPGGALSALIQQHLRPLVGTLLSPEADYL
jgi:hypothetical protein